MSLIDRFLNAIRLNDDFDDEDDFLDEEDDLLDDEAEEENKPKKRFFSRFLPEEDEDDEDFDEYEDPEPVRPARKTAAPRAGAGSAGRTASAASASRTASAAAHPARTSSAGTANMRSAERTKAKKAAPMRRKGALPMEVNVVRPSSMEDTREIADTLMDDCTVVLNLEGLDVDIAQRVIDFTCGVCYSLHGNLQKISSYIFILTPQGVDISGDFQSILDGAFDLPSMRGMY